MTTILTDNVESKEKGEYSNPQNKGDGMRKMGFLSTLGPRPEPKKVYVESDGVADFLAAMQAHGLTPDSFLPDGEIHRFAVSQKKSNLDGYYLASQTNYGVTGYYGDWSRDVKPVVFSSFKEERLAAKQQADLRRLLAQMKAKQEDENKERVKLGKVRAQNNMEGMPPADASFPYLVKKKVSPQQGVRQSTDGSMIAIPAYTIKEGMQTYQRIYLNGKKRFMGGGSAKGAFFPIVGDTAIICICEGYATACTVSEATGYQTFATFSAGNMEPVARILREEYPHSNFVICADNDHEKEKNVGLIQARKAAFAVGAKVALPPGLKGVSDFNDLAIENGVEEVGNTILQCLQPSVQERKLIAPLASSLTANITRPKWLIEGILEEAPLGMLYGAPGSYKSFLALAWALCIATGTPWHGHKVRQGPVLYINGEGKTGLAKRIKAWENFNNIKEPNYPLHVTNVSVQILNKESAEECAAIVQKLRLEYGQPVAIFIDTLARNFGPGDENSTSDMSNFIATLDQIVGVDCLRLIVHHIGWGAKDRGRGSSSLNAALDAEYQITKKEEGGKPYAMLKNTKMKDAEMWDYDIRLEPEQVVVQEDDEGPIISLVLGAQEQDKSKDKRKLSNKQHKTLDCLRGIESGKFDHVPLDYGPEKMHKRNVLTILDKEGIATRNHAPDLLKTLKTRGDIEIVDDVIKL